MKCSLTFLLLAMLAVLPSVAGISACVVFNNNQYDPNKQCTSEEWAFVGSQLSQFQTRRGLRSASSQQDERELSGNWCGQYGVFCKRGPRRTRALEFVNATMVDEASRELFDQNECSELKNAIINKLNNAVMPVMSAKPWPHKCKNLIQSQHMVTCYD